MSKLELATNIACAWINSPNFRLGTFEAEFDSDTIEYKEFITRCVGIVEDLEQQLNGMGK